MMVCMMIRGCYVEVDALFVIQPKAFLRFKLTGVEDGVGAVEI